MEINFSMAKERFKPLSQFIDLYEKVKKFKEASQDFLSLGGEKFIEKVFDEFHKTFGISEEFLQELKREIEKNKEVFDNPKVLWELSKEDFKNKEAQKRESFERMMFVLSLPFFERLRKKKEGTIKEKAEKLGMCPVCFSPISLTLIDMENRRFMTCPVCGHQEEVFRIGCLTCLHKVCEDISILVDENEIRVELCKKCKSYIKSVKESEKIYKDFPDIYLIDIIGLPLDVIAQERGFKRGSPNILGIKDVNETS